MMTATPSRTSIVIATRNRCSELESVLARLLDTTRCPVIVVDNASDDHTAAAARHLGSASPGQLTVIEVTTNLGAVARNIGVAHADTPYIALCDDDSWWEPEAFQVAERLFDRHASVGLLAGSTVVGPERRVDPLVHHLEHSPLGWRPHLPGPSILGFMACSAMVRKKAFEDAGGFSSLLHFRGEEQLLALDLAARGWDLCFCADLVAVHQPSTVRSSGSVQRARVLRNAALTAWLRRPLPVCLRATATLVRAAVCDRECAAAAVEAARMAREALRQRRTLPARLEADVMLLEQA
jgi:GT2 family glycosyltransferase